MFLRQSTGGSYEKDEMQTELFGLDDQWTKKIFFDRVKLTAEEQREYPDRKKPPPWIDTVSRSNAQPRARVRTTTPCSTHTKALGAGRWQAQKGAHGDLWC
jgi:hypothetical protein